MDINGPIYDATSTWTALTNISTTCVVEYVESDLTEKIESAFILNEVGEVDYDGHRIFHRKQFDNEKDFKRSRNKIIVDVITWVSIGLITIIGSAVLHTYGINLIPTK